VVRALVGARRTPNAVTSPVSGQIRGKAVSEARRATGAKLWFQKIGVFPARQNRPCMPIDDPTCDRKIQTCAAHAPGSQSIGAPEPVKMCEKSFYHGQRRE